MGKVIGDLLPTALGVAISPVPIIAVILMLFAPHARSASLAFLVGWVVGVAVVLAVVTALLGPTNGSPDDPSTVASVLKIVLGALAVLLGARQWQGRPHAGETAELPSWMKAVDTMTAVRAGGLGLLLSAANPKNLALCIAGGATIGGAGLAVGQEVIAGAVFVVVASISIGVPVIGYLVAADRMRAPLNELREWLTVHNAAVLSVLLLVIGVALIGKGVGGL
ncbi:GAP family protein [Nocardioides sp. Iso805N]|uniref:GAP family protein n=1 Tax=Nocardioides sp. Iso805N TaxID=1283287 RepID=UPI00036DF635|nr:GAP family protein [Nocardioides sp. Iso805N]